MVLTEEFKNPPVSYRIKPFWFWNGQMTKEEIHRQIGEMADKGLGGMFICARQGMDVPYLSKEWFELTDYACQEAKKMGLEAWLYDEYPYPSGMSGGEVLLEHPEAEHTVLKHEKMRVHGGEKLVKELSWSRILLAKAFRVYEDGSVNWNDSLDIKDAVGVLQTEKIYQQTGLTRYNNKRFFSYDPKKVLEIVLPEGEWEIQIYMEEKLGDFKYYGGFFDPCCKEAVKTFLDTTHERYAATIGNEFGVNVFGMFSDEVGLLSPVPWSQRLPEAFEKRNGYSILDALPGIYEPSYPNSAKLRYDLYETAHRLFRDSYHHQVASWCQDHHLFYATEVPSMRHSTQRFSDIPGGDTAHEKLGKSLEWIYDEYICNYRSNAKAVSSLARQLNRKYAMIESFHSVGWTMNMQDAKWMIDRLGSSGINLYNFHAFYYTIQDITKHDAPPSQFLQNPYWKEYRKLADYVGRMGVIVTNTEADIHVAVLDPIAALWTKLGNPFRGFPYVGEDSKEKAECDRIRNQWVAVCKELLFHQLDYDHLDGELLTEMVIKDKKLCIGRAEYSVVVLPECHCMEKSSREVLERFAEAGGHVITVGQLPFVSIDHEESDEETKEAWLTLSAHKNTDCLNGNLSELANICRNYIEEKAHITVLDGDPKSVIGVCRWERETAGSVYVFAANQGDCPVKVCFSDNRTTKIPCIASWADLESGQQIPAGNMKKEGITVTLEPFESRWLKVTPVQEEKNDVFERDSATRLKAPAMLDENGLSTKARTISMKGQWKCRIDGFNICRFEHVQMSLDQEHWSGTESKTFIEQCADGALLKNDDLVMEGMFGTPRKIRPDYPIDCCYKVTFQIAQGEIPKNLFLLMDRETVSGDHEIKINGHVLPESAWKPVWVNDQNNRAADVVSLVQEGENKILINVSVQKDEEGLRDPLYLWGDFGVSLEEYGIPVLTAQPKQAVPDAPWIHGFPYYSGTIEFEREIFFDHEEECLLRLGWEQECHECIELLINGKSVGVKAYSPYIWPCEEGIIKQGENRITVRITNTLANMLDGTYFDYTNHKLITIGQKGDKE